MTETPIDKGIPVPVRSKYPFHDMEVGDSAFFPDKSTVQLHAVFRRLRPYKDFVTRADTVNGVTGRRVWRVK